MKVPRVTEILQVYTNFQHVPKNILERATARGTSVHALCAGIAKGDWIPDSVIGPEMLGYVNSFKKWQQAQVKRFEVIEKKYSDDNIGFTGKIDLVFQGQDGESYLVDIKTGSTRKKTYPIQLAAYKWLLLIHGIKIKSSMLVYLDKDGGFPDIEVFESLTKELDIFTSALECWYYFNWRTEEWRKRQKVMIL